MPHGNSQARGCPRFRDLVFVIVVALASIAPASADVFGDRQASSYVSVNESPGGFHDLTDTGAASSAAALSFILGTAWSQVDVIHGTLKTFVQTSTSDVIESTGVVVSAVALLDDMFTVTGLADTGTTHAIRGELRVFGGLVTPPNTGYTHYSGVFVNFASGVMLQRELWPYPSGGELHVDETVTHVFAVWPDQPFQVRALMQSYGQGWNHFDILSDFSATATLHFELPPGATISSSGGYAQAMVPLPASIALFAPAALVWMAMVRRHTGHEPTLA